MSVDEPTPLRYRVQREYTLDEAVELMKMMDRYPTSQTIQWVDARTRKPVAIGYNDKDK